MLSYVSDSLASILRSSLVDMHGCKTVSALPPAEETLLMRALT